MVEHGKVITAAGVSAGIDMALTLLARMHGPLIAEGVQLAIEYDPSRRSAPVHRRKRQLRPCPSQQRRAKRPSCPTESGSESASSFEHDQHRRPQVTATTGTSST